MLRCHGELMVTVPLRGASFFSSVFEWTWSSGWGTTFSIPCLIQSITLSVPQIKTQHLSRTSFYTTHRDTHTHLGGRGLLSVLSSGSDSLCTVVGWGSAAGTKTESLLYVWFEGLSAGTIRVSPGAAGGEGGGTWGGTWEHTTQSQACLECLITQTSFRTSSPPSAWPTDGPQAAPLQLLTLCS